MKLISSIDIYASPDRVFYWLEDPDRTKKWMTSVTKSEIIKNTPNKVGTTFREYIEENGRGTEMNGLITEFIQNKKFAVHLEGDFNSVDVCFSLKDKGGMTQLTQDVNLKFKGMLKILSIFIQRSLRKKIQHQSNIEFSQLKELCEEVN